jgi:hypothetical protein
MGLWPHKLMKTSSCSATTFLEAPPSPLSSRPERTRISCFAMLINATALDRKSGGAQWRVCPERSRMGTCGSAALSWRWYFDRGIMAFGPPKVMKNGSCSVTTLPGSTALPLSSRPERSAVEGPAVRRSFLGNVFRQRNHGPLAHPR